MLGFHSFRSARVTLQGIERMHMIKKGQMIMAEGPSLSAAEPVLFPGRLIPSRKGQARLSETNATQPFALR